MSEEVLISIPQRVLEDWWDRLIDVTSPDVLYDEDQLVMANRVIQHSSRVVSKLMEDISKAQIGAFPEPPKEQQ